MKRRLATIVFAVASVVLASGGEGISQSVSGPPEQVSFPTLDGGLIYADLYGASFGGGASAGASSEAGPVRDFDFSVLCLALTTGAAAARGQRYQDFTTPTPLKEGNTLIVGFMGGRESWDNDKRGVRKLALKLRAKNLPGVHVETVENKRRKLAVELIRNAFDRDRDGRLDERERASARLVVYGQSFGGAAVVKLARQLKGMGVPVLLTVQVDSVGRGDKVIPSNVAHAANLFQRDGLIIKGEREIRAEDPSRTRIIGNFKFDYEGKKINLTEVSWLKRLFQAAHTKMDHDPEVWALAERLILDAVSAR